jgi:hypothetical protein
MSGYDAMRLFIPFILKTGIIGLFRPIKEVRTMSLQLEQEDNEPLRSLRYLEKIERRVHEDLDGHNFIY